ncbi:hypothetical protein GIB67_042046 [Kingdonia uniflora]|uniref:Gamma-tubulin complex component n=1 Tax=Kingdonia uniflora TaxID=39325 RepID=A0A7J7MVM7_9MAGN|nr:hypothetical protein GIB67_042046 [Kingdonia uniflora]
MCRLLWHGHQVMYHQVASWMVYGILQDQHAEFFIRRYLFPKKISDARASALGVLEPMPQYQYLVPISVVVAQTLSLYSTRHPYTESHKGALEVMEEIPLIFRYENMDVESESGSTQKFDKVVQKSPDHASLTDWHLGFHIFLDLLPNHIHMRVAESILFAGKAVRVLRNPSSAFKSQDAVSSQQVSRGSQKVVGYTGHSAFQKKPIADRKLIEEDLLPQSEADKIDTMLQELKESSEFHKRSFESAADSVRAIAASHLWQLVVVRADLNGHLKTLKDYFLLAKGDFFQVDNGFIAECEGELLYFGQTNKKLVSLLKIHRQPNSKKNDDLEMNDSNDQLTTLEMTVFDLTSTVEELVKQLHLTNLATSTSVKRRGRSKKKGVMEVDGEDDIAEIDNDYSDAESVKKRSGIESLSWKEFKVLVQKQFYSIGYEQERWYKGHNLCQKFEQSVQEYTTVFHNQVLVLDIDVDEYEVFMKYTRGLSESIRRELKLFTAANIEDATVKAIAIEDKYLKSDKEDDKNKLGYKSSWKYEHKGESKGEGSLSKENSCNHCKASGHISYICWKLYPELRPKEEKSKKERYALAAKDSHKVGNETDNTQS